MASTNSNFDELYLETDEEVTSAIEKIKKSKKSNVALVLPRNTVLGQSIVNLKLIYRQALEMDKSVVLVSPDRVTRNLADRVGFTVAESSEGAEFPQEKPKKKPAPETTPVIEEVAAPVEIAKKRFDTKEAGSKKQEASDEVDSDEQEQRDSDEIPLVTSDTDVSSSEEVMETIDDDEPQIEEVPVTKKYGKAAVSGGMIPTRGNLRMYRSQKRRPMLLVALGLIILGLAGLAIAAVVIPTATVKLTVKAQPFSDKVTSTVSVDQTTIDTDKGILPGTLKTLDQETKVSAKATGKKDQGTKATGVVTIYNAWDSSVHTFPAGTEVFSKNATVYVTKTDISVAGATSVVSNGTSTIVPGKKDVAVEASQPGEAYNVGAMVFTIPSLPKAQQEKIYATSDAAMTGGSSKIVTVVTADDVTKLTDAAKTQNKDEGIAKLKSDNKDQVVIDKAVQVVSQDATASAKADDATESLEVTVAGKFQLITFKQDDQKQLLQKLLAGKIPQGQTLVTQGTGVDVDTSQFDLNLVTDKKLELVNNIKAFTINGYDEGAIRRALVSGKPTNIVNLVKDKIAATAGEATIHPAWWPRLPLWADKIKIDLTYTAS